MRSRKPKTVFLVAAAAFVTALCVAGAAWACTALPSVSLTPENGPMGTKVLVNGNGFNSGVPIELRWGSPDGPLVGVAQTGNFSVPLNLPADARSGVHYLVAIQANEEGVIMRKAASAFELTSGTDSQASISSDLWPGFSSAGSLAVEEAGVGESSFSSSAVPAVGAGLLSFGFVALAAGLVAAVSRRRAELG